MPKGRGSVSWYTNIYDLKSAKIHVFREGDFSKAVVIDLKKELKNGKREIDMEQLMESVAQPYLESNSRSNLVLVVTVTLMVLGAVILLSRRSRFLKTHPVNETPTA